MSDFLIVNEWLQAEATTRLDLTNPDHQQTVQELADQLLQMVSEDDHDSHPPQRLLGFEHHLVHECPESPLAAHLAVKLACSKAMLAEFPADVHFTVVFAVYKESRRLLTREQDPYGEDFLCQKVLQLDWLFSDRPKNWKMIVVDDGCPDHTGCQVEAIIETEGLADRVSLLYLDDAIRDGNPVTQPLRSTDESRKGGSIQLGMAHAAADASASHVIIFTDGDLSTHLGQCARLAEPIVLRGKDVSIGSRRDELSVVIKEGHRDRRGRLFIYLWKRLLPALGSITDTQCGFKAFRAAEVLRLVDQTQEKQFAFDIELLIRAELHNSGCIQRVPLAWIDSEALSTTKDVQPYLSMLRAIVGFYRHYLPPNPSAEPFAKFIESLNEESWERLIENIPDDILRHEASEMTDFDGVSAAQLDMAIA